MQLRSFHGIAVAAALLVATSASADKRVNGFVAGGAGQLVGVVVDDDGHPVGGAKVHVVSSSGSELIVTTDAAGRYRADTRTDETYSLVFVYGDARIGGSINTNVIVGDDEVVEMHEALPPAVLAKPLTNPAIIPDYSDTAMDRDVWTSAWLLLDITETGAVRRIKLLNRAGYDLDAIAVRDAFKLKFEPARDRANRAIPALMLWAFEWPAYWWMRHNHPDEMKRMPGDAKTVPCRGTGPTHTVYRDCSQPNVANAVSQPWIEKPRS